MKIIGLTGGIGSGKSTVAQFFKELGATIIDADDISHQLLDLYPELVTSLVKKFGELDRQKLAEIVFKDSRKRKELEALTHPFIRQEIQKQINAAKKKKSKLVLVDAALLVETGYYKSFEGLLVVKAKPEQQIKRTLSRKTLSRKEVEERMASQLPLAEKLKVANGVIDNSGSFSETKKQVEKIFDTLVSS